MRKPSVYENERIVEAVPKWTPANRASILCPFHKEATPSCVLEVGMDGSRTYGHWRCFGCELDGGWELIDGVLGQLRMVRFDSMVRELHAQGLSFEEIKDRVIESFRRKYDH